MSMMISVAEILTEVEAASSRQAKIDILRRDNCLALKMCLKANFDPTVQFIDLGEKVEYHPDEAVFGHNPSTLHMEWKKFYLFQDTPATARLVLQRRRQLLMQICEALHPDEAEIFYAVIRKKLKRKGLTEKLVREAFPGLLNEAAVPLKDKE